jgi:hypothetical protein
MRNSKVKNYLTPEEFQVPHIDGGGGGVLRILNGIAHCHFMCRLFMRSKFVSLFIIYGGKLPSKASYSAFIRTLIIVFQSESDC